MLQGWIVVAIALAYIGLLFLVASYGDRKRGLTRGTSSRLLIYPLSLAVYCTSWTFFGSVGIASRTGFDFLTIYIGPLLIIGLGYPLIIRIVRLAKGQNITSIADFVAARYGKSPAVAATVALIAIIGMIPYIALQLKAVSASVSTILTEASPGGAAPPLLGDVALFVALAMATFAVLFGTRHTDATEHQDGLMLAIAAESIVKLMAFLAVGVPVWDIRKDFGETSMLVANAALGKSLADTLGDKPVVLMRGHGDVTVGPTVKMAVFRAYYTDVNAKLQAQAIALGGEPNYLTPGEGVKADQTNFAVMDRIWNLWRMKVLPTLAK